MKIDIKQWFRYLLILMSNFTCLIFLLSLWTDKLIDIIDTGTLEIEILKISCLSFFTLIVISIYTKYSSKSQKDKLKRVVLIVLVLHSYFYFDFIKKSIRNRIIKRELRESASRKIIENDDFFTGFTGKDLSNLEYKEIDETTWLPEIKDGENINISYQRFDALLPDSELKIEYFLPINSHVDEWHEESDQHIYFQKAEKIGDKLKVTYVDSNW